jgi:signal peptidase I
MPLAMPEPVLTRPVLRQVLPGRGPRLSGILRHLCQCLALAALAVASYFFVSRFFLQSVQVVGPSMAPTLRDSQRYLLNRWIYYVRAPQRADIVVIRDPANRRLSVKRIIASPGDSLYLKDGSVCVNGHKLEEPYLPARTLTFPEGKLPEQWLRCGKDQYIVLGDNRRNSTDSRSYGPVGRHDVLGCIFP